MQISGHVVYFVCATYVATSISYYMPSIFYGSIRSIWIITVSTKVRITRTVMSTNGKIVINSKCSTWTSTSKLYDDWDNKDNYILVIF